MLIFTPRVHHPKGKAFKLTSLCAVQGRLVLRGAMHTWGPGYFRFHDPQAGTSYAVHFRVSTLDCMCWKGRGGVCRVGIELWFVQ